MLELFWLCFFVCTRADFGLDTSTWERAWPIANLSCLRDAGSQFIIIEAYRTKNVSRGVVPGHVVGTALETIANARAAGFADVQLYHFPDVKQDPEKQINLTLDTFRASNISQLWLDVEGPQYWSTDCDINSEFLGALVQGARSRLGASNVGIYSSESQWQAIMCGNRSFSNFTLWRPHYDGAPNNSDWPKKGIGPFGGWDTAAMKQYKGDVKQCGIDVDLNWRFLRRNKPTRRNSMN
jgi:hypothetical protein